MSIHRCLMPNAYHPAVRIYRRHAQNEVGGVGQAMTYALPSHDPSSFGPNNIARTSTMKPYTRYPGGGS